MERKNNKRRESERIRAEEAGGKGNEKEKRGEREWKEVEVEMKGNGRKTTRKSPACFFMTIIR